LGAGGAFELEEAGAFLDDDAAAGLLLSGGEAFRFVLFDLGSNAVLRPDSDPLRLLLRDRLVLDPEPPRDRERRESAPDCRRELSSPGLTESEYSVLLPRLVSEKFDPDVLLDDRADFEAPPPPAAFFLSAFSFSRFSRSFFSFFSL